MKEESTLYLFDRKFVLFSYAKLIIIYFPSNTHRQHIFSGQYDQTEARPPSFIYLYPLFFYN